MDIWNFVVGQILQVDNQQGYSPQTAEEAAALTISGSVTSSISGADADKFVIRDTEWGTQIFFTERPVFSSPADADGDNTYVFDLTKTSSDGQTATSTVNITVNQKQEGSPDALATPTE